MSDDYDPVECLREEVKRFKATNQFTPMLVTGFYIQAAVVLDVLDRAREDLADAQSAAKKDRERLDWLDDVLQQGDIEIYSRLNLDSDSVDLRDAIDATMAKETT